MRERHSTRRAVLAAVVAAAGTLAVGGCRRTSAVPSPDPERALLLQVIAEKERVIDAYLAAIRAHHGLAEALNPLLTEHQAHVAELRRMLPPTGAHVPTRTQTAQPTSANAKRSVARLREKERQAAASRAKQIERVSPALAQLLASIGASEAVHAVALGRVP